MENPKLLDISNIDMPKELPKIPFYLESEHYEIAYSLFEACNLHCKFCFEGHRSNNIEMGKILEAPQNIFNEMVPELEKYPYIKHLNIRLWGGELFFDAIPDIIFEAYHRLVEDCRTLFMEKYPELKLTFSWLSNGVWTKWDRIKALLDYSNGVLGFSYDPADRFPSKKAEDLMIENTWRAYKEGYLANLSITLTKQTIKQYISGQSSLKKFPPMKTDVNYYTANPGWKDLVVDDDDLYEFFKWALKERLFDINIIENLMAAGINKKEYFKGHYCDCKTCKQYSNGYCTVDCAKRASILPHKMFYGKYSNIITEENVSDIKLSLGMLKRGCLTCPYYNLCQKPCWITVVFEGFKPTSNCPYAKIYKDIQEDKELIKDFIAWSEENERRLNARNE